jgi:hypothetical protein
MNCTENEIIFCMMGRLSEELFLFDTVLPGIVEIPHWLFERKYS